MKLVVSELYFKIISQFYNGNIVVWFVRSLPIQMISTATSQRKIIPLFVFSLQLDQRDEEGQTSSWNYMLYTAAGLKLRPPHIEVERLKNGKFLTIFQQIRNLLTYSLPRIGLTAAYCHEQNLYSFHLIKIMHM